MMDLIYSPETALALYENPEEPPQRLVAIFNNYITLNYKNIKDVIKFCPWDEEYKLIPTHTRDLLLLGQHLKLNGWLVKYRTMDYETMQNILLCSKKAPWATKLKWFLSI